MSRGVESRGAALLLLLPIVAAGDDAARFDFTPGGNAASRPMYEAHRGFGFEAGDPAQFSVRVPEGNYLVTLRFGRTRQPTRITVQAEQRRFMAEDVEVGRRHGQVVRIAVNVRTPDLPALPDNATGGTRVALKPREIDSHTWDDRLTVGFDDWPAALQYLEVQPAPGLPTLYLAGDSTVADQPVAPGASWGQFVTRYFTSAIAVANHAESGETLKSFVTEMRLAKLLSRLRAGDWVMIQFGHNDQKAQWPQTYVDAATTYRDWLRTYVAEVRSRGATPVLVTSPERRNFDADGRIRPTLAEYADALRVVAREQQVALIDLNAASVQLYEALGPGVSPRAFADGGDDHTHHNEFGARLLARCVIAALRKSDLTLVAGLADHIAEEAGALDPARPPVP